MASPLRLLVVSGGTGGHLFPGLAVAEAVLAARPDTQVSVLGPEGRTDVEAIAAYGFSVHTLRIRGLASGARWLHRVQTAAGLALGVPVRAARRALMHLAPDVVFAAGGYVAGPVVVAARRLGIPSVVFDMNCPAGLATRWAAGYATVVALGSEESAAGLTRPGWWLRGARWPPRVEITGTPVRRAIRETDRDTARRELGVPDDALAVLLMSGSLGSQRVNAALVDALPRLARDPRLTQPLWVLHLTGTRHAGAVPATVARDLGLDYRAEPFRRDLAEALAAADLVVTRAGGSALAEIAARGLPAIVIPWAQAPANHQEGNARRLAALGAAVVLRDGELSAERLSHEIANLCLDPARRAALAAASRALGTPDAAARIATLLVGLAEKEGSRTARIRVVQ